MDPLATVLLNKPELLIKAAKSGWKTIKKFFDNYDAKDSIDYGDAYFDYLQNTVNSIGRIKTLIYRHVPKFLYLFYEYPTIKYQDQIIDTSNAQDILDINNKLIVTGIGGIGKSLLLKHFFLNIAQYGHYIPVLIELRKFNQMDGKEISLYDAIYQNLSDNGFKLADKYYKYSLEAGGYVILLDGFDEVNRDKAQKVFDQIQSFSQRYNKNHFIVSSRPSDHFVGWNDFHEMFLCDLTKKQAFNLIQKIDFDEAIKKPFSDALDSKLFDAYESFASNPLLLTIMLLTFGNHAALPENPNDFYEQAFSTLFNGHDATKDYFVRDIRSHLSYENFKTVFSYICFKSFFKNDFEFSEKLLRQYIEKAKTKFNTLSFSVDDFEEDLTLSVCMLIKDGLGYSFIHRSFQEYFAALYTCKLLDSDQYALLTAWISTSDSCSSDEYMKMLFDLQDEKVNKIILCSGIKQIKKLYDEIGFSYDFLSEYNLGISIRKIHCIENGLKVSFYSLGLHPKTPYFSNIINLTCNLNNYVIQSHIRDSEVQKGLYNIAKKYKEKIGKSSRRSSHILYPSYAPSNRIAQEYDVPEITLCAFADLDQIVDSKQLLNYLEWYHERLRFCFSLYEKYTKPDDSNPKTVSSILDNL